MQLMQICFGKFLNLFKNMTGKKSLSFKGIATSADVAYTSYLYSVVNKSKYKRVTSLIRMATMTGKFAAYSFGQFLVSTEIGDYLLLNQASLIKRLFFVFYPLWRKNKKFKFYSLDNFGCSFYFRTNFFIFADDDTKKQ
ncbi:hypothetical protein ACQ4LE_009649 [Meloidogyne hapla]